MANMIRFIIAVMCEGQAFKLLLVAVHLLAAMSIDSDRFQGDSCIRLFW